MESSSGAPSSSDGQHPVPASVFQLFRDQWASSCGYCGSRSGNHSYHAQCDVLTVQDYQDLMDNGWRRSGSLLYRPDNQRTCCMTYSIRLDVSRFQPNKAQRKVSRTFDRVLNGESLLSDADSISSRPTSTASTGTDTSISINTRAVDWLRTQLVNILCDPSAAETANLASSLTPANLESIRVYPAKSTIAAALQPRTQTDVDMSAAPSPPQLSVPTAFSSNLLHVLSSRFKKLERVLEPDVIIEWLSSRLALAGIEVTRSQLYVNLKLTQVGVDAVLAYAEASATTCKSDVVSVASSSSLSSSSSNDDDAEESQGSVHRARLHALFPPGLKRAFTMTLVPVKRAFSAEVFELYKRYQITVHKDKRPTPDGFKRFLCSSPLVMEGEFGSFHQQYRLDGRLIAVGVLDVLPRGLSGVYFFYDPDLHCLNLGTLSALKEIDLTRELHTRHAQLRHYYMGLYIYSCQKMRYKGKFAPSELLCDVRRTWHPLSACLPTLQRTGYAVLSELCKEASAQGSEEVSTQEYRAIAKRLLKERRTRANQTAPNVAVCVGESSILEAKVLHAMGYGHALTGLPEFVDQVGEEVAKSCRVEL